MMVDSRPYIHTEKTEDPENPKAGAISAFLLGLLILLVFVGLVTFGMLYAFDVVDEGWYDDETVPFAQNVNTAAMMTTLQDLYNIAQLHNGSRAVKLGYNASLEYVKQRLEGYYTDITVQPFGITENADIEESKFSQTAPEEITYTYNTDFISILNQGSGDVTGPIFFIGKPCDSANWQGFPVGHVAFALWTGECRFRDIYGYAQTNGAIGALIATDDPSSAPVSTGLRAPGTIPGFSLSGSLGSLFQSELEAGTILTVSLYSKVETTVTTTMNLIACTDKGLPDSTIIIGSHLDSVPAGPGINDNGSGSAVNLEIALEWAIQDIGNNGQVNRVCFAWWAAEEMGLLGSTFFVNDLVANKRIGNVALNINMDMVGSPNAFLGIYNGSEAEIGIRPQSETITHLFINYFNGKGLPYAYTSFDGRSDYGPFIANGVPAGGLFTGAEQIKNTAERTDFGGMANAAYDPCYHQYCDTVNNIDQQVLLNMARSCATVTYKLATQENLRAFLIDDDNRKAEIKPVVRSVQDQRLAEDGYRHIVHSRSHSDTAKSLDKTFKDL